MSLKQTSKYGSQKSFRNHNYTSRNDLNYDNITDRFISTLEDNGNQGYYRSFITKSSGFHNKQNEIRSPITGENGFFDNPFLIRDDNFLLRSNQESSTRRTGNLTEDDIARRFDDLSVNDGSESEPFHKEDTSIHKVSVAKALGFRIKSRILNFRPSRVSNLRKKPIGDMIENKQPSQSDISGSTIASPPSLSNTSKEKIKTEVKFKVLDAPGLRNDFYANVVSWGRKSDRIAVGLGTVVYTWSNKTGTTPLQTIEEVISCVSYSYNDILAVGTKTGRVIIYSENARTINTTSILRPSTGICCICWIKGTNSFFAGDDLGEVTLYELIEIENGPNSPQYRLTVGCSFKCNEQQICGIDISPDRQQVTVGGNDNCCTIWDIRDLHKPVLKSCLPHQAAVKAIAYCPWMPHLLATGGGSKDRNIRFWHTNTGTLLDKIQTKGQVTSLIWSKSRKEILATFGFGDNTEKPILISVYSYPSMKLQVKLASTSNIRVLSAVSSHDSKSICTAISDQSVRIYSIWNSKYDLTNGEYDSGLFGSELIELEEGVDSSFEIIR
ncbi:hypothetical protein KL928_003067 [Ogataea angusta]|uniref:CDC20/Fizzy WD40 domain-containing protein n=1 Tax=Pichia angusta TaxID=870730 RepID=A0AAN6DE26_PICAN|nr:uncharacterized protein KL928_003067 [Ogataea angusta]KAG7818066.1 hypothetical protein KL928_003067 [Ogataea angusta]KAG7858759.1 hypothetical protein KL939_002881 [Ogataea angusta]